MPGDADVHIGARIASHRKLVGYTQRELSDHAHLSLGAVRKVERGERIPTHGVLTAVARALHVTVEDLTGQPYRQEPQDERVHAPITAIRAALRHWDLPADWYERPQPIPELRKSVATVTEYRLGGRLTRLSHGLPGLLEELTAAVHLHEGADRRQAARLLTLAYDLTHTLTYRLGYPDLRGQVEDRLRWSASLAADPLLIALAEYKRVEAFKSANEYNAGLRVLAAGRERLAEESLAPAPQYVTMLGAMRLREVTMASRARDAAATEHHLAQAAELLNSLPSDVDRRQHCLVFGRGNVAIHTIQAHLELQRLADADEVIRSNRRLPKSVPATRQSAWHINAARFYLAADRREQALQQLQKARRVAPQVTRYKPMARDAALLLMLKYRRTSEELRLLSSWFGLDMST